MKVGGASSSSCPEGIETRCRISAADVPIYKLLSEVTVSAYRRTTATTYLLQYSAQVMDTCVFPSSVVRGISSNTLRRT
jgi:hypothetical protein